MRKMFSLNIRGRHNGPIVFRLKMAGFLFVLLCLSFRSGHTLQKTDTDLGRRYNQSAQLFYARGDYEQALKDWNFIIENLPDSAYADDALIAIGRYYLEIKQDPETARSYFDRVLANYPQADKAPAAHFYQGWIRLQYGLTSADLEDALASFERVMVLYPRSPWAGESALKAGMVYWILGRPLKSRATCRQAMRRLEEPRFIYEAWLCIARAHALEGQTDAMARAFVKMQQLPLGEEERRYVLDASTAYYRHFIRKASRSLPYYGDPDFHLDGSIRLDDPKWVFPIDEGFAVVDEDQKWVIRYQTTGKFLNRVSFSSLDYATAAPDGQLFAVVKGDIMVPGVGRRNLQYAVAPGKTREVKAKTLAIDRSGRLWVHHDDGGIILFQVSGEGRVQYVASAFDGRTLNASRVQIDPWQRLWVLSEKTRSVRVYFRDGQPALTLQTGNWKMEKPVSVGWDILGFIYILDRKKREIGIFSPAGQLLKVVNLRVILQNVEPRDMAVKQDGSLYLLDGATRSVFRLI